LPTITAGRTPRIRHIVASATSRVDVNRAVGD
jgi:hypothetical protein